LSGESISRLEQMIPIFFFVCFSQIFCPSGGFVTLLAGKFTGKQNNFAGISQKAALDNH